MQVFFVTAEVVPFSGTGPAAEDSAALPKALRSLDHEPTVISPLYQNIDPAKHALARRLSKVKVEVAGEEYACEVYTGRTVSGAQVTFLGHDLFRQADALVDEDAEASALRAGVFAQAAAAMVQQSPDNPEVVHGIGWVGALALNALRAADTKLPLVLSDYGPLPEALAPHGALLGLGASSLLGGADRVVAGSWAQARGLEGVTEEKLSAIPSGLDSAQWNPLTDPNLPARFDPVDLGGKAQTKAEVQRRLELPVRSDVPLIAAMVSGGNGSAGLELLARVASEVLRNDVQLIVLLSEADGPLIGVYEELWDRWPDRIQVRTKSDEALRHQTVAASDFFVVVPEAACATHAHRVAQRYGSVPVAHRVGALAELVDCDAALKTGNAFGFDNFDGGELLGALQRAIGAFDKREAFEALRKQVMRIDHSWERSARRYDSLYRDLLRGDEEEEG